MPSSSALDNNKKLEVNYRVEGGCLGPVGHTYIDNFCEYAQQHIENNRANFISLNIMPRHDKSIPEMQFKVLSKKVSHAQAEKYLSIFGQNLDDFESELIDQITLLIKNYAEEFIK